MPFINNPSGRSWKQIAEDLRDLQDRITTYQSDFRDADSSDIADKLERCIGLLIEAQGVAEELSRGKRWRPGDP